MLRIYLMLWGRVCRISKIFIMKSITFRKIRMWLPQLLRVYFRQDVRIGLFTVSLKAGMPIRRSMWRTTERRIWICLRRGLIVTINCVLIGRFMVSMKIDCTPGLLLSPLLQPTPQQRPSLRQRHLLPLLRQRLSHCRMITNGSIPWRQVWERQSCLNWHKRRKQALMGRRRWY